jgi:ADP-ribose diphosphatase
MANISMSLESEFLRAYRALRESRPELFRNFDGNTYEILFDSQHILEAQASARAARETEGLPADDLRVGLLATDPYLTLLREAVRFPDGSMGLYNRVLAPVGATILPMLDDHIVLLHRFRHGTRSWHLEAPRGMVTGEDSIVEAARRELREEIGAIATSMHTLGAMHASNACSDEVEHLFLARIDGTGTPDRHEAIDTLCAMSVPDFERKVKDGEITDAPTLAAFLRGRLRGLV